MENDELQHHGIKGMKWGVRRTKAQLGYKTSPKKKKRSPEDESAVTKAAKKVGSKMSEAAANHKVKKAEKKAAKEEKDRLEKEAEARKKPKSLKDMSDQELAAYFQRLNMEKNVLETQRRISELQPQKVSAGKKYMESFVNQAVMPAVNQAGRDYLTKVGKQVLGLDEKTVDSMKTLKDEVEKLRLENDKSRYQYEMENRGKNDRYEQMRKDAEYAKNAHMKYKNENMAYDEFKKQAETVEKERRAREEPMPAQNVRVEDVPRETYNTGRNYINTYLDDPIFGYLPEPEKRKK